MRAALSISVIHTCTVFRPSLAPAGTPRFPGEQCGHYGKATTSDAYQQAAWRKSNYKVTPPVRSLLLIASAALMESAAIVDVGLAVEVVGKTLLPKIYKFG